MTQTADIPGVGPTVYLIHFDVACAHARHRANHVRPDRFREHATGRGAAASRASLMRAPVSRSRPLSQTRSDPGQLAVSAHRDPFGEVGAAEIRRIATAGLQARDGSRGRTSSLTRTPGPRHLGLCRAQ